MVDSIFDALGYACGFAAAIIVVALFRELIGTGALSWGGSSVTIIPKAYTISLFASNSGAFIALGLVVALYTCVMNAIKNKKSAAKKVAAESK